MITHSVLELVSFINIFWNIYLIVIYVNIQTFQQAKFHYTSSTVHVFYQLHTPVLDWIVVILNATCLMIMFPLQINVKCNEIENAEPISIKCQTSSFRWLSAFARANYYYCRCSSPIHKGHKAFRKQVIPIKSLAATISLPLISLSLSRHVHYFVVLFLDMANTLRYFSRHGY